MLASENEEINGNGDNDDDQERQEKVQLGVIGLVSWSELVEQTLSVLSHKVSPVACAASGFAGFPPPTVAELIINTSALAGQHLAVIAHQTLLIPLISPVFSDPTVGELRGVNWTALSHFTDFDQHVRSKAGSAFLSFIVALGAVLLFTGNAN